MGENVAWVADRPFGRFRPCIADSPLPSVQGALNCVHNSACCQTCILIRIWTLWSYTHCDCHILLLFNELSIVFSLAGNQPAFNHAGVLYSQLWMMRSQLQHEGVFAQLFSVILHLSWWNSGRVSAFSRPTPMLSNYISLQLSITMITFPYN